MGWCSGTDVFDRVAEYVINSDMNDEHKLGCLSVLIDALEDKDWDCESDSRYYDHLLVQSAYRQLHPDWFEYRDE